MKILHTSDWHLGQSFLTKNRRDEHQAFLTWLLEQVQQQNIDAVIIAGDVFDTGSPPSYAREMYNQFVVDLNRLDCTLVVLGGNHDSVSTLNESKALLACLNTYVIANSFDDLSQQVITLKDRQEQVGAIVCAVPFIRPRDVIQSVAGETSIEKKKALGQAIQDHYQALYQLAVERQSEIEAKTQRKVPIIATGHLTALGVTKTDSVRDIYIGSLEAFDASAFPPVDYIALGHIHRPQIVAKSESIRYCGSPIPLSFDEIKAFDGKKQKSKQTDTLDLSPDNDEIEYSGKQVIMVEFAGGQKHIQSLPIPLFQPMAVLTGDLKSIEKQLQQFAEVEQTVWLCVQVEIEDYLSDLQPRVQALTEGYNVEVLQLKRLSRSKSRALSQMQNETLAELTPLDVFEKRLQLESFDDETGIARKQRITEQFKQIVADVEQPQMDDDLTEQQSQTQSVTGDEK